jgi:hypothetical protein
LHRVDASIDITNDRFIFEMPVSIPAFLVCRRNINMTIANTTKTATILDGLPGMIEASERRGQAQLVSSTLLPSDMSGQRELFEKFGFKFGERVKYDPMFIHAELPAGWSKKETDHSMWSKIVDERGVDRVAVFYKAAFYDRSAHMYLECRYNIDVTYDGDYSKAKEATAKVLDLKKGTVLFEETKAKGPNDHSAYGVARDAADAWCKVNFPDYEKGPEAWLED